MSKKEGKRAPIGPLRFNIDYDYYGSCFSTRKLDEGPVLNKLGRLCLFLYALGLKEPEAPLAGKAPVPKFLKKLKAAAP